MICLFIYFLFVFSAFVLNLAFCFFSNFLCFLWLFSHTLVWLVFLLVSCVLLFLYMMLHLSSLSLTYLPFLPYIVNLSFISPSIPYFEPFNMMPLLVPSTVHSSIYSFNLFPFLPPTFLSLSIFVHVPFLSIHLSVIHFSSFYHFFCLKFIFPFFSFIPTFIYSFFHPSIHPSYSSLSYL